MICSMVASELRRKFLATNYGLRKEDACQPRCVTAQYLRFYPEVPFGASEELSAMKTGMNLLLWTTHVTAEHFPILAKLKETGFDGVEVPLFEGDAAHFP